MALATSGCGLVGLPSHPSPTAGTGDVFTLLPPARALDRATGAVGHLGLLLAEDERGARQRAVLGAHLIVDAVGGVGSWPPSKRTQESSRTSWASACSESSASRSPLRRDGIQFLTDRLAFCYGVSPVALSAARHSSFLRALARPRHRRQYGHGEGLAQLRQLHGAPSGRVQLPALPSAPWPVRPGLALGPSGLARLHRATRPISCPTHTS